MYGQTNTCFCLCKHFLTWHKSYVIFYHTEKPHKKRVDIPIQKWMEKTFSAIFKLHNKIIIKIITIKFVYQSKNAIPK